MNLRRLWIIFVGAAAAIHLFGFLVTTIAFFLLRQTSVLSQESQRHLISLMATSIAGAGISVCLIVFLSHHFFVPIRRLIQALDQVAEGDFSVQLPECSFSKELQVMNLNFNKMVRQLNSTELLQSNFIQDVSHEFKTPLAAVEGYASLLSSTRLSSEQERYVLQILRSTRQLSSLTGNILQLSRLENQQVVSQKQIFSLDEQLRQAVLSLEPIWSRKKQQLALSLPSLNYYGNAELTTQIWTNLLSNAIKFTPEGGTISIDLEALASGVQITFRDTGIGISQDALPHIFDKFFQAERGRSVEGNGLGLALVKKITALCGGTVRAESQLGKGAVFVVTLPPCNPPKL